MKVSNPMENITDSRKKAIEQSIIQAASDHLNARDAETALSHYIQGATVITNGKRFDSFEMFEKDVREFYKSLKDVKQAVWQNIQIRILSLSSAVFTATVRWQSVDTSGYNLKLKGIWSAVYIQVQNKWKIIHRHESFESDE